MHKHQINTENQIRYVILSQYYSIIMVCARKFRHIWHRNYSFYDMLNLRIFWWVRCFDEWNFWIIILLLLLPLSTVFFLWDIHTHKHTIIFIVGRFICLPCKFEFGSRVCTNVRARISFISSSIWILHRNHSVKSHFNQSLKTLTFFFSKLFWKSMFRARKPSIAFILTRFRFSLFFLLSI